MKRYMTDKENPFDELHAAFKQLEEKNQAPELENPDYAALLELREAFDDGFKGSVLIERTMFALREYFKSSTISFTTRFPAPSTILAASSNRGGS